MGDGADRFPEIVDGLLTNLFKPNESSGDDNQDGVKIDENASLALTFMFPEIYLKALAILDNKQITIYRYQHTGEPIGDKLFGDDSMVLIDQDTDEPSCYVDLNQWFCSCSNFQLSFKLSEISNDNDPNVRMEGYGYRDSSILPQFQVGDGHKIPTCEHLLSCYILKTHRDQLHNAYNTEPADTQTWLALHSKIPV